MINIINDTGNEKKDILLESLGLYQNNDEEIKNKEFTQYRNETFLYRQQLIESNPTAFRVFDLLTNLCEKNNTIIISCREIGNILNKNERTMQRAIKELREYNFIVAIKYKKNNIYFLNPYIACRVDGATKSRLSILYRKARKEYEGDENGSIIPKIEVKDINENEFNKKRTEETLTYKYIKPSGKVTKIHIDDALDQLDDLDKIAQEKIENFYKSDFDVTPEEFEEMTKNFTL